MCEAYVIKQDAGFIINVKIMLKINSEYNEKSFPYCLIALFTGKKYRKKVLLTI